MKTIARVVCLILALLGSNAHATMIYDWVTTSYASGGGQTFPLSDLFSINASWTLADSAVERGYIQLTGYNGWPEPYPHGDEPFTHPEEIIDFSFTATSLDGSRSYAFDKFDTGIDFAPPNPWSEAYHTNLRLFNDSPTADISLWSADALVRFSLFSTVDIGVTLGDVNYFVLGHWQRREVPEPSSLALFSLGLIGLAFSAKSAFKKTSAVEPR